MLGWQIAETEEKRKPFNKQFVSLGVQIDLTSAGREEIILRNKPGRVKAIQEQIEEILRKNECGFQEALSIKGKLAFAEGQVFGRVAAPVNRILSFWAKDNHRRQCNEELVLSLKWIVQQAQTY